MIRTAWRNDLPALRELFAGANDGPYDLAAVAEEKCFGLGVSGMPVVRVFEAESRIAGAAVSCGKWLRVLVVARDRRRSGIGTALLRDAEARGAAVVAAEPGNYFTPGVVTSDEGTVAFFRRHGYIETRWTNNLEAPLAEVAAKLESLAASGPVPRRPTHEEADRVLDFVEKEFGPIWRFEASKAFECERPRVVVSEENGEVTGFAVHEVNNRGLGTFGPTGVAKSMRGRGIGARVLLASLADLARMGYSHAVIPWTDSVEFYRKSCDARPAHRFTALSRKQG